MFSAVFSLFFTHLPTSWLNMCIWFTTTNLFFANYEINFFSSNSIHFDYGNTSHLLRPRPPRKLP